MALQIAIIYFSEVQILRKIDHTEELVYTEKRSNIELLDIYRLLKV